MITGVFLTIKAKVMMFYFPKSQDTYTATHKKTETLSYGIVFAWLCLHNKTPISKTAKGISTGNRLPSFFNDSF